MTRWLEAAQRASGVWNLPKKPKQRSAHEVDLVNSVLSTEQRVDATPPDRTPAELARDLYEERATIRKSDGGQDRATDEREARDDIRRDSTIVWLRHWTDDADDITNPDVWR